MTAFITVASIMLGSFISSTTLLDDGPYAFVQEHSSIEACQLAIHGTRDICTHEGLIAQYVLSTGIKTKENLGDLEYIDCSYWAGCYLGGRAE